MSNVNRNAENGESDPKSKPKWQSRSEI